MTSRQSLTYSTRLSVSIVLASSSRTSICRPCRLFGGGLEVDTDLASVAGVGVLEGGVGAADAGDDSGDDASGDVALSRGDELGLARGSAVPVDQRQAVRKTVSLRCTNMRTG